MKRILVKGMFLGFIVLLLGVGCATVGTQGMLNVDPTKKDSKINDVKFSLFTIKNGNVVDITDNAIKYYPNIFSNEFTALPVMFELKCNHQRIDNSSEGALIFVFTLTLVPGPDYDEIDSCYGRLELRGFNEFLINKDVSYEFTKSWWIPGPLYLPFVPFVHSKKQFEPLEEQTLVEYAVVAINHADPIKLENMYNYRKQRLQKVTIYGEPYWVFISLDQTEKASQEGKGKLDVATLLFWKDYPKPLDRNLERVVVATYENDTWQPVMSIPRRLGLKKLAMVSVKIEDERPASVVIKEDVQPKIEYFMYLSNPNDPEEIHWSNNMLIDAKNLTFPDGLRQKDRESLLELQTQFEKEILRLNEKLSKLDLSLQQKLIKNENVQFENALIPIYQQRITIFEALIASIKQAMQFK